MDSDGNRLEQLDRRFIKAVTDNDIGEFKSLLGSMVDICPEVSVEKRNEILYSSLVSAAEKGYAEIAELILDNKGIQVNKKNPDGLNPLDLASQNGHLQIVEALLRYEDIEVWTQHKLNPLHLAAKNGHLEVVRALLSKKDILRSHFYYTNVVFDDSSDEEQTADFIDSLDENNNTALQFAAQHGHVKIVEFLSNMGASVSQNYDEDSPLHLAAKGGHTEIVELMLFGSVFRRGFHFHDEYDDDDYYGDNYDDGKISCVKVSNDKAMTPLLLAAEKGHHRAVEVLLQHYETNINATGFGGSSALHLAAKGGHLEVVKILVGERAIHNLKDNSGKTAMIIAQENGHPLCVQAIRKRFKK